jgi:hypothetical protein
MDWCGTSPAETTGCAYASMASSGANHQGEIDVDHA